MDFLGRRDWRGSKLQDLNCCCWIADKDGDSVADQGRTQMPLLS